mgnify:CR=1 FL=1|tara:strand:+ start:3778 stop:4617 length:840 start_codon:yes stop_codon:yes gene_type:complete
MIQAIDHIIIAVENLDHAETNYKKIFGVDPVWRGKHKELGTKNSLFNLQNTYLELLAADGEGLGAELVKNQINEKGDGLIGIVYAVEEIESFRNKLIQAGYLISEIAQGKGENIQNDKKRVWKNLFLPEELTKGLFAFIIEHSEGKLDILDHFPHSSVHRLDHVVINTKNGDDFIKVYRDLFGIRLALDKVIKHWKKRILFFRVNKTTIEVIEDSGKENESDELWGLAWEVKSLEEMHKRLKEEGVEYTPIKKGLKEGTLVSTIKSHTHNVPTLVIENT